MIYIGLCHLPCLGRQIRQLAPQPCNTDEVIGLGSLGLALTQGREVGLRHEPVVLLGLLVPHSHGDLVIVVKAPGLVLDTASSLNGVNLPGLLVHQDLGHNSHTVDIVLLFPAFPLHHLKVSSKV